MPNLRMPTLVKRALGLSQGGPAMVSPSAVSSLQPGSPGAMVRAQTPNQANPLTPAQPGDSAQIGAQSTTSGNPQPQPQPGTPAQGAMAPAVPQSPLPAQGWTQAALPMGGQKFAQDGAQAPPAPQGGPGQGQQQPPPPPPPPGSFKPSPLLGMAQAGMLPGGPVTNSIVGVEGLSVPPAPPPPPPIHPKAAAHTSVSGSPATVSKGIEAIFNMAKKKHTVMPGSMKRAQSLAELILPRLTTESVRLGSRGAGGLSVPLVLKTGMAPQAPIFSRSAGDQINSGCLLTIPVLLKQAVGEGQSLAALEGQSLDAFKQEWLNLNPGQPLPSDQQLTQMQQRRQQYMQQRQTIATGSPQQADEAARKMEEMKDPSLRAYEQDHRIQAAMNPAPGPGGINNSMGGYFDANIAAQQQQARAQKQKEIDQQTHDQQKAQLAQQQQQAQTEQDEAYKAERAKVEQQQAMQNAPQQAQSGDDMAQQAQTAQAAPNPMAAQPAAQPAATGPAPRTNNPHGIPDRAWSSMNAYQRQRMASNPAARAAFMQSWDRSGKTITQGGTLANVSAPQQGVQSGAAGVAAYGKTGPQGGDMRRFMGSQPQQAQQPTPAGSTQPPATPQVPAVNPAVQQPRPANYRVYNRNQLFANGGSRISQMRQQRAQQQQQPQTPPAPQGQQTPTNQQQPPTTAATPSLGTSDQGMAGAGTLTGGASAATPAAGAGAPALTGGAPAAPAAAATSETAGGVESKGEGVKVTMNAPKPSSGAIPPVSKVT